VNDSASARIDVSILVTTFRRPRHLALVLESIARQRTSVCRFDVVVADDGSDDGTAEFVHRFAASAGFPLAFTTQPHEGFRLARVRNNAARLARGDYLVFLDGDCMIPPQHLASHFARRRPGVVLLGYCARLPEEASRLLVPDNVAVTNIGGLAPAAELALLARRHRRAWWHNLIRHPSKPRLAGGDFGVWRSDFERVNGFDENFRGWGQEDDDLGLRLRAAGLRLESILDRTRSLHVWHPTDPTATRRWRDGANVAYFERRGRLTACRNGLAPRAIGDIVWGLPADVLASHLGRGVAHAVATAPRAAPGEPCEIDVVVNGDGCGFSRPAECRLAIIASETDLPRELARRCDQVVRVAAADAETLRTALETAG
jgi:glycosyltransferase involved in cell wall biosynthesis